MAYHYPLHLPPSRIIKSAHLTFIRHARNINVYMCLNVMTAMQYYLATIHQRITLSVCLCVLELFVSTRRCKDTAKYLTIQTFTQLFFSISHYLTFIYIKIQIFSFLSPLYIY